jgi:hypothetical protein
MAGRQYKENCTQLISFCFPSILLDLRVYIYFSRRFAFHTVLNDYLPYHVLSYISVFCGDCFPGMGGPRVEN